jgi:hypothetical protein
VLTRAAQTRTNVDTLRGAALRVLAGIVFLLIWIAATRQPLRQCRFDVGKGREDTSYFSYGHILRRAPTQFYLTGRVHVDTKTHGSLHFADGNLPGVIEVARDSYVPAQRLTRVTIGGALQSIQFANAYRRGILILPEKRNAEDFRDALNLVAADKGGHIFEPSVGVFGITGLEDADPAGFA